MPLIRPTREDLRRTVVFASLSDADCDALIVCLCGRRYAPGEVVFHKDDVGTTMILVAEGELHATVVAPDGVEHVLNRMGPGQIVGEMALFDPAPRSATVKAATVAVAYELDRDALEALRQKAPGAASALVMAVVHEVTWRLRVLDDRVAAELARRAERGGPAPGTAEG